MNLSDKSENSPPLRFVSSIDIYHLKDKYSKEEFDSDKAHAALQELFKRFGNINLLMENQPVDDIDFGNQVTKYLTNYNELSSTCIEIIEETSKFTSLHISLNNYPKDSKEYKFIINEIKESKKRSKSLQRKYSLLKKQGKNVYSEMLQFEKRKKRYNFFGFRIKFQFLLIKAGLLLGAIFLTFGLDRLGLFIDDTLKNNYYYHAIFLLVFYFIDRLVISPLEEKFSKQLSKKLFFDGVAFLEEEYSNHQSRYSKNVESLSSFVNNMLDVTYLNAIVEKGDIMKLPVKNLNAVLPFYENEMGFILFPESSDLESKYAVLFRPHITIGLIENGNIPHNYSCGIEVNNVENALNELKNKGLTNELSEIFLKKEGNKDYKLFNLVAPDGLQFYFFESSPKLPQQS